MFSQLPENMVLTVYNQVTIMIPETPASNAYQMMRIAQFWH